MSAYSHNHTSSCVRRFCRSVPDRSVFIFLFFYIYCIQHSQLQYTSVSLKFYFFFYQFSFSRHWVVALLHQQNYHLTGRKTQSVHCFPIILFHSAFFFFAYQWVAYSLLRRFPFGETDQGQTRRERGNTVSSSETSHYRTVSYLQVGGVDRALPRINISVRLHDSCCPSRSEHRSRCIKKSR